MKERKSRFIIVYVLVFMIGCLFIPKTVYAGNINGNEAGVISAAQGTFTYNGKQYRAGSAYINQLEAYLAQDDIDLTAEQAASAISQMYGSIQQGVEGGYLYEVGGTSTTTESNVTETTEMVQNDTEETNRENTEEDTEEQSGEDSSQGVDVWDVMSVPTESKQKLQNRPDVDEAYVKVKMDDEEITVTTKNQNEIQISENEPIIPDGIMMAYSIVSILCLILTIGMGVVLFATKCMVFRKVKRRKARPGHSKRRKIRHNTRAVLTVTTGLGMLSLFIMLGIYIGLFNQNALIQNMQSSGYFRYAYTEYIASFSSEEQKEEKPLNYEDYLFEIKQNTIKVLDGNTDVVIPESNVAPYVYNLRTNYRTLFWRAGIYMLLASVLGMFLMVFMDQRRERGIKHIAVAELATSVVIAFIVVGLTIYKPYLYLYIEPDYLYLFVMECIRRCLTILGSVTGSCIVIGMILIGVYKSEQSKREV